MFTFSPNTKAKSAEVNQNFTDVTTGAADTSDNNLRLFRAESAANFVTTGLIWSTVSGLAGTMTTGGMYVINPSGIMIRVLPVQITSKTFTASKDTYIDIDYNGLPVYVEVANGATTGFPITANAIRVAKVVTGASTISSILIAGHDLLGNIYRNVDPYGVTKIEIPTFTNSWVNYDTTTFPAAGYWKDRTGMVHLQGLVKLGTIDTSVFTLPAGYRPTKQFHFPCLSNSAIGGIRIYADGTITLGSPGSNAWFALENVHFKAAAQIV